MVMRLILIKPFLLQGITFYEPCWLLIATILLNVTSGRAARPVFFEIRKRWPTMEALSQANSDELRTLLLPLGLGDVRTQRLISFAKLYLQDPPSQDKLRPSRVTTVKGVCDSKYPPTAVSHLPGMGRYALDSYRIFCCQEVQPGEWKKVMPWDKELRVYLRWRWAVEGYIWDCEKGVLGPTSNDYLNELCEGTLDASCVVPPRYRL
ncbi:DNA glycosylase [Serendipita vermifera]|nr:DNA glycosylase [Serendipita vermifera]